MYLRKNYTWLRKLKDKFKYNDDLWASCWPIALHNSTMLNNLQSKLGIKQNIKKTIFGFLYIFNHRPMFFKKDGVDIQYISVYTDILSIYLVVNQLFTKYSDTYQSCKQIVRNDTG